jgi:hypothetical protein
MAPGSSRPGSRPNSDTIELVDLPSYAPEHNPDEVLNNDVKQAMTRRRVPKHKADLKKGLTSDMRGLQVDGHQSVIGRPAPTVSERHPRSVMCGGCQSVIAWRQHSVTGQRVASVTDVIPKCHRRR